MHSLNKLIGKNIMQYGDYSDRKFLMRDFYYFQSLSYFCYNV